MDTTVSREIGFTGKTNSEQQKEAHGPHFSLFQWQGCWSLGKQLDITLDLRFEGRDTA